MTEREVAVVVGAGPGLGNALVHRLAQAGMTVAAVSRQGGHVGAALAQLGRSALAGDCRDGHAALREAIDQRIAEARASPDDYSHRGFGHRFSFAFRAILGVYFLDLCERYFSAHAMISEFVARSRQCRASASPDPSRAAPLGDCESGDAAGAGALAGGVGGAAVV